MIHRGFVLLLVAAVMVLGSVAQGNVSVELPGMIVSGEWLEDRLGAESLVVLHVGGDADYAAGHVPGALLVKLSDVSVTDQTGLRLQLPSAEVLADALQALGISDTHRVVIYHGTESVQSATRVWYTFDYLQIGAQAAMLDGGLALWKREGRPLTTQATTPSVASKITVKARPEVVASIDWVKDRAANPPHVLLDARLPQYYSGADPGAMPRAGHIPGARNAPYTSFFDVDGRWKTPAELRALLQQDGQGSRLVVSYCHIGQQATVPYFAARLLGLDAKMFDGSFQAWSRDENLPVSSIP